jgi:chromosome segregation ATPase
MRKLEEIIRELPENIRGPIYEAFVAFRDDIILKETREIKAEIGRVWEVIKELAESQKRTEQEIEKIWVAIKELTEAQKRTEQEIEKIWGAIKELAEAQKRTEQRLEELAEAQKRTEQRLNELAEAQKRTEQRLEELAEAQKRTEQRLNELAEAQKRTEQRLEELAEAQKETERKIKELTEAQKETEQRINELAEAQKRTEQEIEKIWGAIKELTEAQKKTEQRVNELAEAQRKTEETLKKLIEEHSKTREKLEGLSHSFGYLLEDRAMKSLPKILKRKYNIKAVGNFVRDYFTINGEHVEVNIFGKVKKGNKEYILIGEAKSQVTKKAIDKFLKKCDKISRSFSKETIKVFISYIFSPGIKEYAEEKGIVLIPSYELDL